MKSSALICTVAAVALLTSSLSFADDRGRPDDYRRDERHAHRHDDPRFDMRDGRFNERRDEYNARGPEFHRGGHIPYEYRSRVYEVDYREHHLRRPPPGQRWVQVGADYVLVAIATGVIVNILLSH